MQESSARIAGGSCLRLWISLVCNGVTFQALFIGYWLDHGYRVQDYNASWEGLRYSSASFLSAGWLVCNLFTLGIGTACGVALGYLKTHQNRIWAVVTYHRTQVIHVTSWKASFGYPHQSSSVEQAVGLGPLDIQLAPNHGTP
jgi:hypothetical protein